MLVVLILDCEQAYIGAQARMATPRGRNRAAKPQNGSSADSFPSDRFILRCSRVWLKGKVSLLAGYSRTSYRIPVEFWDVCHSLSFYVRTADGNVWWLLAHDLGTDVVHYRHVDKIRGEGKGKYCFFVSHLLLSFGLSRNPFKIQGETLREMLVEILASTVPTTARPAKVVCITAISCLQGFSWSILRSSALVKGRKVDDLLFRDFHLIVYLIKEMRFAWGKEVSTLAKCYDGPCCEF